LSYLISFSTKDNIFWDNIQEEDNYLRR